MVEGIDYMVVGKEVAPETGRKHLQIYVELTKKVRFTAVKKLIACNEAHIEPCGGTQEENIKYCCKEGNFQEFGNKKVDGVRLDKIEATAAILAGDITPAELLELNPAMYHQFGRTFERAHGIAEIRNAGNRGDTMPHVTWCYGTTGTGKSHYAFNEWLEEEKVDYRTDGDQFYVKNLTDGEKKWWDGYSGQKNIIINEFRGELDYAFLLQLLDKWPMTVSRRCLQPVNMKATRFVITSALLPHEIYKKQTAKAESDSIHQLIRRISRILHFEQNLQREEIPQSHYLKLVDEYLQKQAHSWVNTD
nr:MAG: replication associated protein [Cressdnaviricota sp.]